jgi:hypothetical protein
LGQTTCAGADAACAAHTTLKESQLRKKAVGMQHFRGVLMLVASGIALYRGWKIHAGTEAWLAYGLGVAALGLAVWHLTRQADGRRA